MSASPPIAAHKGEDELFALLLKRIPASVDRHQLEDATMAALQLILRRTGDGELIDDLRCRTALATAGIPEAGAGSGAELAKAAADCVKILHEGRQARKPREGPHEPVHGHPDRTPSVHHQAHPVRNPWRQGAILALLAVGAAIGAWAFWHGIEHRHTAAELVEQMSKAATGASIPTHVFGGQLTATKDGTAISIVADKVPADICVSASWVMIRKGVVAINGTTPPRVTASQLSDLCHEKNEGATLTWTLKQDEPGNRTQ